MWRRSDDSIVNDIYKKIEYYGKVLSTMELVRFAQSDRFFFPPKRLAISFWRVCKFLNRFDTSCFFTQDGDVLPEGNTAPTIPISRESGTPPLFIAREYVSCRRGAGKKLPRWKCKRSEKSPPKCIVNRKKEVEAVSSSYIIRWWRLANISWTGTIVFRIELMLKRG